MFAPVAMRRHTLAVRNSVRAVSSNEENLPRRSFDVGRDLICWDNS
jgi:hypothetical protein